MSCSHLHAETIRIGAREDDPVSVAGIGPFAHDNVTVCVSLCCVHCGFLQSGVRPGKAGRGLAWRVAGQLTVGIKNAIVKHHVLSFCFCFKHLSLCYFVR